MKNRMTLGWTFLFVVLLFSGCTSEGVSFTGRVTFDDGTPVTGGTVVFESGATQYDGQLRADGSYSLGGNTERSGIPYGTYAIAVVVPGRDDGTPVIAEKYGSSASSGLTFEVKADGPKTLDIKVEKP